MAGVIAVASDAAAQSDDDKLEAKKLLGQGDKALGRGDRFAKRGRKERAKAEFERALEHYNKAYELVPIAQIYFPIGQAEERLERWADAMNHYQQVLASPDLNEQLRKAVQARVVVVAKHLATLTVTVDQAGAEIYIDGKLRGKAPLDRPIYLAPGDYAVAVKADHFTAEEVSVTVEAGEEYDQSFELERVPVEAKSPDEPAPEQPAVDLGPPPPSRTGLLVGGIITLTLAGAATGTGLAALSKQSTFDDTALALDEREAARDSGKKLALATDLLVAGAVIAGAYTAYHYVKVYRPSRAAWEKRRADGSVSATPPDLLVAPYVDSRGGGLAVMGRF